MGNRLKKLHPAVPVLMVALFLLPPVSAEAIEILLAPILLAPGELSVRPRKDLLSAVKSLDHLGAVELKPAADSDLSPSGVLEAAIICSETGTDYLIFGYIQQTEICWDCELKFYNNKTRRIEKKFFARDSSDQYGRLITDLSKKVLNYFYVEIGMAPYNPPAEPERNIFLLPMYLNYWTPGGRDWGSVATGIARAESGVLFCPLRPLFFRGDTPWELQTGLTLAYSLAVNDPDYESFILHSIRLNAPVTMALGVSEDQFIDFGLGFSMQFDILSQDRLYYGEYSAFSSAPGWFLQAGYRYRLTSKWSLGLRSTLEFVFYNPLQTSISLGLSGMYEFSSLKGAGTQ